MRLIKTWKDLVGLENKDYRLEIDTDIGCGWIVRKSDNTKEVYLSTHTLYERNYQASTKLLVSYGFDVVILKQYEIGV